MDAGQYQDGVRLSAGERRQLLERLETLSAGNPGSTRRQHERLEYHAPSIPITIRHPGGTDAYFRVCSRNLSSGGIGVLYAGFVHPETECELLLVDVHGKLHPVLGHVRSCRHVYRRVHELGIAFKERLDPRMFVGVMAKVTSRVEPAGSTPQLAGIALVQSTANEELRLFQKCIATVGMQMVEVETLGQILDAVSRMEVQTIFCHLADPQRVGSLCQRIRDTGYNGPLIGLTNLPDCAAAATLGLDGYHEVLVRPVTDTAVYRALETAGHSYGLHGESAPILTTLDPRNSNTGELVRFFTTLAHQAADQIEGALASG
ncbi:MAG: PilZ domain-containing protein, partial [Phycisphaerales bacterium]|nr:PilZ domain-containing protein [Phycisphaerales bacterium]